MRTPSFLLLLCLSAPMIGMTQEKDSTTSGKDDEITRVPQEEVGSTSAFGISLGLHEGLEPSSSLTFPGLLWERGFHRVKLGFVAGRAYRVEAGSRGSEWIPSDRFLFRGAALSYGVYIWRPSERVALRSGLDLYLLNDAYQAAKGKKDPQGSEYSYQHRAQRTSLAGAPFLNVEFLLGKGFSLSLGFQPLRYRYSVYRWEGGVSQVREGVFRGHRFFLQKFGVSFRTNL